MPEHRRGGSEEEQRLLAALAPVLARRFAERDEDFPGDVDFGLVGHLYAAARELARLGRVEEFSQPMEAPLLRSVGGARGLRLTVGRIETLGAELRRLPLLGPDWSHDLLVSLLHLYDLVVEKRGHELFRGLPPETHRLDWPDLEGHDWLDDQVTVWVHGETRLGRTRVERDTPSDYLTDPASLLLQLRLSYQARTAPTVVRPACWARPDWPRRALQALDDRMGLRLALAPLPGSHSLVLAGDGRRFVVDGVHGADALWEQIERVLAWCRDNRIDLLALPELQVPLELRERLESHRRGTGPPRLLVPGSFHTWPGAPPPEPPRNEALVLHGGHRLVTHHKRGRFYLPRRHCLPLLKSGALQLPKGVELGDRLYEALDKGGVLQVLRTEQARIAVVICADLIDDRGGFYSLLEAGVVDLVVVLMYSPKTREFRIAAEKLQRHGVAVVCINAATALPAKGPGSVRASSAEVAAWVSLPFFGPQCPLPTVFGWTHDRQGLCDANVKPMETERFRVEGKGGPRSAVELVEDPALVVIDLACWLGEGDPS